MVDMELDTFKTEEQHRRKEPQATKTPCNTLSAGTSKEVLIQAHKAKMSVKHIACGLSENRIYRILTNVSKNHPDFRVTPSTLEALQAKRKTVASTG
jgi:hypothetical protein